MSPLTYQCGTGVSKANPAHLACTSHSCATRMTLRTGGVLSEGSLTRPIILLATCPRECGTNTANTETKKGSPRVLEVKNKACDCSGTRKRCKVIYVISGTGLLGPTKTLDLRGSGQNLCKLEHHAFTQLTRSPEYATQGVCRNLATSFR